jgi:hypothetical protein
MWFGVLGWLLGGCMHPTPTNGLPLSAGGPILGLHSVRVVPTLRLHPEVRPDRRSPLGLALSENQVAQREHHARQLDSISEQLSWALPAEVNGALGDRWGGHFERVNFPTGARNRLANALVGNEDVPEALAELGRAVGGDAVLLTWVDQLRAVPMTVSAFPGEVVDTPVGPVVVDATNEPFRVWAGVGVALITSTGVVISHDHATYDTVLRGPFGLELAALDLAAAVADRMVPRWDGSATAQLQQPD